jgi:hypothetical protein
MSKVISDARQQVVRASQLGDVIVSKKLCQLFVKNSLVSDFFTVILNLSVPGAPIIITLISANSHATQNANVGASKTCPTPTAVAFLDPGTNIPAVVINSSLFAIPGSDDDGSFPDVHPPDFTKELSTVGSFDELDAAPSFDVT